MAVGPRDGERAPEAIERFIKQLLVAYKAAKLYPAASDIPQQTAADLLKMLRGLVRDQPEVRFSVTKDALLYGGLPVVPGSQPFELLARELYHRGLAEVRFHAGVTPREVVDFLRLLQVPADELGASGGFEQRLWDLQVDGVSVKATSTRIVEASLEDRSEIPIPDEDWPPSRQRIDELIESAYGARPRDQRMLVRFAQSPRLVARYLDELASDGRGGRPLANLIAGRVVSLARVALAELAEDQPAIHRALAEALLALDPDVRRDVLVDRLLPESRVDDAVASVIRQFELTELCNALVEGMGQDAVSRDGLARAIRNLAVIGLNPKEDVLAVAAGSMRAAGMDEAAIGSVLEDASPQQLRRQPLHEEREHADSVESVVRLVDLAPVAAEALDDEVMGLRDEIARGISDGDILMSVVTLLAIERRPDVFASLMSAVEDGLGMLLEWGDFDDAASAVAALDALAGDETLEAAQRSRARDLLAALATPRYMKDIASAMRVHDPDTPEHAACRRLVETLGGLTISPLLEVLADEPDMTARKALVDTISRMASQHVAELGERTGDPRWFFVRNVVAILGSTRNPEALAYLNRTLRHADERVRRETIRAVASVRDRLAEEMLVAALSDDDAQNVALAARYLGSLGVRAAVQPLAGVARGDGRGSRENGPRIEAIEALGRIGTADAESALTEIARQRAIIRRTAKTRELQAAAESALGAIARRRAGGERS